MKILADLIDVRKAVNAAKYIVETEVNLSKASLVNLSNSIAVEGSEGWQQKLKEEQEILQHAERRLWEMTEIENRLNKAIVKARKGENK